MLPPSQLKNCPFCGKDQSKLGASYRSRYRGYCAYIRCYFCGAMGPAEPSKQAAIEGWNRREGEPT